MLKLSRVRLSPEQRGQQAGKSSKSLGAFQFVWVYQRHFAKGLHLHKTFFLQTFNMRVTGSEKFSWPVTFPVQGGDRKCSGREKGKAETMEYYEPWMSC